MAAPTCASLAFASRFGARDSRFIRTVGCIRTFVNFASASRDTVRALHASENCQAAQPRGLVAAPRLFADANRIVAIASSPVAAVLRRPYSTVGDGQRRRVQLTDFDEITFPSSMKVMRNRLLCFLITGYFDPLFRKDSFLEGAAQAIVTVSNAVAAGRFQELHGLLTPDVLTEVQANATKMTDSERKFLAVAPSDIMYRFMYEVGMIFDDATAQRFIEITVVAQGMHGFVEFTKQIQKDSSPLKVLQSKKDDVFICNYRFIREFTKNVNDSWTVNKLNHFCPCRKKEVVS